MKEYDCPIDFWDYCVDRRTRINNMMVKNLLQLNGYNAHNELTGDEDEIYNLYRLKWYDWCYFCDNNH